MINVLVRDCWSEEICCVLLFWCIDVLFCGKLVVVLCFCFCLLVLVCILVINIWGVVGVLLIVFGWFWLLVNGVGWKFGFFCMGFCVCVLVCDIDGIFWLVGVWFGWLFSLKFCVFLGVIVVIWGWDI